MLKGCQKKIVFLKNTGSKFFDEAYFVIRDKKSEDNTSNTDLIIEANKIIDECIGESHRERAENIFVRIKKTIKKGIIPFALGMAVTVASVILIVTLI